MKYEKTTLNWKEGTHYSYCVCFLYKLWKDGEHANVEDAKKVLEEAKEQGFHVYYIWNTETTPCVSVADEATCQADYIMLVKSGDFADWFKEATDSMLDFSKDFNVDLEHTEESELPKMLRIAIEFEDEGDNK